MTPDGSVFAGSTLFPEGNRACRWTLMGGVQSLGVAAAGDVASHSIAITADGSMIIGLSSTEIANPLAVSRPFVWTQATGTQVLGIAGIPTGMSATGSVMVGYAAVQSATRAVRWSASGMRVLGPMPGEVASYATTVSADGATIAGTSWVSNSITRAFRWTNATGVQNLGLLSGADSSHASAVSADGAVVVGTCTRNINPNPSVPYNRAFRWTEAGGLQDIGLLNPGGQAFAMGLNGDGSIVVGFAQSFGASLAFRWTPGFGMVDLNEYLPSRGVNLAGWVLTTAHLISADGSTIAGLGKLNGGDEIPYVVRLPVGCLCSADFNCSSQLDIEDVFDFLNAWLAGEVRADFNGSGVEVSDIFDFLNAWFVGC